MIQFGGRSRILFSLTDFGIPMKLASPTKVCLNKTHSTVRVGNRLSDRFPNKNSLKQKDTLSPLLFNFALQHAIRKVQVKQDDLKLNGTHQLLVYADGVNISGGSKLTIKENTEALLVASKETTRSKCR
jgi:hypothetical protein